MRMCSVGLQAMGPPGRPGCGRCRPGHSARSASVDTSGCPIAFETVSVPSDSPRHDNGTSSVRSGRVAAPRGRQCSATAAALVARGINVVLVADPAGPGLVPLRTAPAVWPAGRVARAVAVAVRGGAGCGS